MFRIGTSPLPLSGYVSNTCPLLPHTTHIFLSDSSKCGARICASSSRDSTLTVLLTTTVSLLVFGAVCVISVISTSLVANWMGSDIAVSSVPAFLGDVLSIAGRGGPS